MKYWFLILISFSCLVSAESKKEFTLKKIREYCKACHAVDELRFIHSDNNDELWDTLFNEKSPKSGKIWVDRILAVLDWPGNLVPPFDEPMSQNGDWMPKGYKRLLLAEDSELGVPTRQIILETLKAGPNQ